MEISGKRPDLGGGPFGRPMAMDLWRSTLTQIPTHFGRIVFLASLRDPATGTYSHPYLSQVVGVEDADRTLNHSHQQVFQQWLGFSLMQQKNDLDEFLSSDTLPRQAFAYHKIVPPKARDVERQLYLTDLETLLELLRYEHAGAFAAPEA
jgi:hypothetical protein